jgi:tetratricopeptide (TPR) repeat protein
MKTIKFTNLVCLFLLLTPTVFGQITSEQSEREALVEGTFRKYLMTGDKSFAQMLVNSENTYSLFCKALFADKEDVAIDLYTKFIAKNPKYGLGEAYFNRGILYNQLDSSELAVSDFDKAIELGIKDPYLYYFKGASLAEMEKYDNAIESYSIAIKMDSKFGLAYLMRGNSYYKKKEYSKAISDYNKVIELDKKEEMAYIMRGLSYESLGDYKKALDDLQKAKNLKGANAETANKQIERINKKIKEK